MTKKILVTGSSGILGNLLVKKLNQKYKVIGTTKRNGKKSKVKCDITKREEITRIIQKIRPDIIIHLAGITGNMECEKNPKKTLETNVMGTYHILESIKDKKIKIIFASSREVYGNSKQKVDETSSLMPINLNGFTKMISENLIKEFNIKYKIPYNILRFTNFYGENNHKRGISKMFKEALTGEKITIFGGEQSIDLIHYDDAVNAIVKTIDNNKNGVYNIGLGKSLKLLSILKILEKTSKMKFQYIKKKSRGVEVQKFSINTTKAKQELQFEAKITPKIGIKKMVEKWKEN
jgi:UDP-glucose 4-epimerase